MGPQRILQAAVAVALAAVTVTPGAAAADPQTAAPVKARSHERIAVIDLGVGPPAAPAAGPGRAFADIPQQLQAAIVAAGFTPVIGDGVDDALAGRDVERDAAALAAAIADAEHAF